MLAFTLVSELSILAEDWERLVLDVWLVAMLAFTLVSELSTLEEELERALVDV